MKLQVFGLGASLLLGAATASAQDESTMTVSAPRGEYAEVTTMPNVPLIATGGVLFLGGYIPSMFVAGLSYNSSDQYLWIPVAGPWVDLADRGCGRDCTSEALNKAVLVADGVAQGVGVIMMIAGAVAPMKTYKRVAKPEWKVTPMQMGKGPSMGAGVVGTF